MMINNRKLYLININSYLEELSVLTDRLVNREDLMSINESMKIHESLMTVTDHPEVKFKLKFCDREEYKFSTYIQNLYISNNSKIYIFTDRTKCCGLFQFESIKDINFSFPYEISDNGVIVFVTTNLKNRLLLDFYSEAGEKFLDVEVQGNSWANIEY